MQRTKIEIVNEIEKLEAELPLRQVIASISEHEGLDASKEELKLNCCESIKAESFKEGKSQIKNLEVVGKFLDYLKQQKERVDFISGRIEECRAELTRLQLNIDFDFND